jgi:microcystin degradation protein MlrC
MRILVASIIHETNSFSPVATPLSRFGVERERGFLGTAEIGHLRGTDTEIAGFVATLDAAGASYRVLQPAEALPSGPVVPEVFEELLTPLEHALADGGYDGVLLALHGAMVIEPDRNAEAEITDRLQRIAPDVPLVASFDMHANLDHDSVRHLRGIAGYQTYPHVDCAATGRRAARQLVELLHGRRRPVVAFGRCPMLPHVMAQGSYRSPNRELQALAASWERSGEVLAASVFTGFPHADVPRSGLSAVVVGDGDRALAEDRLEALLSAAWSQRRAFVFSEEPLADSIARAVREDGSSDRPIVLLDHCDNTGSGGTMDTTTVLQAMLEARLERACFYGIRDPEAVQQCMAAGVGATLTLALGAKSPAHQPYARSAPLKLTGLVKTLHAGIVRRRGPFAAGTTARIGPTAVLEVNGLEIAVLSSHVEPADLEYFHSIGIDPARRRFIGLKSRVHWRAGFEALEPRVIECSGSGVCVSDYGKLDFKRLSRPIFPLDEIAARKPAALRTSARTAS